MNFNDDVSPLGSLSLDKVMGSSMVYEHVSHEPRPTSRDRNGLIERIKRVKSPLWQFRQDNGANQDRSRQSSRPSSRDRPKTPTGSFNDLQVPRAATPDPPVDHATAGLEIARPRSALHSGDFREREGGAQSSNRSASAFLATSPVVPWNRAFPAAALPPTRNAAQYSFNNVLNYDPPPVSRAREISRSPSTSFTFMPPTSPLVQQTNNTDLDFTSRPASRRSSRSPDRSNRRHTFSPDSFQEYQTTQMARSASDQDNLDFRIQFEDENGDDIGKMELRRKEKKKRRSTSPKAPPGGCYRIPAEGQLQIVLKNPNRTAVKLFLVPYDVSDMEPGQKTFIRQRSYSAGPIIDMPLSSRKNLGTDRPEAALSHSDDPRDRPVLRYLIHLHICCTGKGRYYLYKSIRVVFANRVPDGKEKLRNEIQQPEPKYSTYKPSRDSTTAQSVTSPSLSITEKTHRRQSAAWPLSRSQQMYDQMDGVSQNPKLPPPAVRFTGGPLSSSASGDYGSNIPLMQPIPFNLTRLVAVESRPASREQMDVDSKSPFRSPPASPPPLLSNSIIEQEATFEKLNKGDVGYGGNAFSPLGSPASPPAAGLLAQRLRGLDVQPDDDTN
ncbi:hypothetical protein SLS59_007772 [Nothophoma quercina]|uniref:Atos-like C-terminal domain-containing protein n=1 Tax=Nothophoma quercina TaxID=749835 RepID=A0ABR3QX60_9PLEO